MSWNEGHREKRKRGQGLDGLHEGHGRREGEPEEKGRAGKWPTQSMLCSCAESRVMAVGDALWRTRWVSEVTGKEMYGREGMGLGDRTWDKAAHG